MSEKTLTFLERVEMDLPMTAQEVFDQAVGGVIRQGRQSGREANGLFRCLYRDGKGGACAYGQCIPDSMYHEHMEANGAAELDRKGWAPKSLQPHTRLLEDLQSAHDNQYPQVSKPWVEVFKGYAEEVAVAFGLAWNFEGEQP